MDEIEITGIVKDMHGTISHCGVKGYGIQNVGIIEELIRDKSYTFFIYDGDKKMKVYTDSCKWNIISYNGSQWF